MFYDCANDYTVYGPAGHYNKWLESESWIWICYFSRLEQRLFLWRQFCSWSWVRGSGLCSVTVLGTILYRPCKLSKWCKAVLYPLTATNAIINCYWLDLRTSTLNILLGGDRRWEITKVHRCHSFNIQRESGQSDKLGSKFQVIKFLWLSASLCCLSNRNCG